MSEDYVLVYFSKDHTYTVAHDPKRKLINQNKANIMDAQGKWNIGKIMFRGTELQCEKRHKTLCPGASDVEGPTDCEAVVESPTPTQTKRKSKYYKRIIYYIFSMLLLLKLFLFQLQTL